MSLSNHERRLARSLWDYLRLGQEVQPTDWILVFGSHDLSVAHRAADLYHEGVGSHFVVSGGTRSVPEGARYGTEAEALREILVQRDVPTEAIAVEALASNTSENFWFTAELLRDRGIDAARFLVVQKPYAERRIIATAKRRWPAKEVRVTSEAVTFDRYCARTIAIETILSMLAGEVLRLESYARSGLIDSGEQVPAGLVAAARGLEAAGYNARALA
jgi:uncharacterized SAM-binding protein YcdF (DUF218 family)